MIDENKRRIREVEFQPFCRLKVSWQSNCDLKIIHGDDQFIR